MDDKKLIKKNQELDLAIEEKRRKLLAQGVGAKVAQELTPHLEAIALLVGGLNEKDTESGIINKLDELKETLKTHEIEIEI